MSATRTTSSAESVEVFPGGVIPDRTGKYVLGKLYIEHGATLLIEPNSQGVRLVVAKTTLPSGRRSIIGSSQPVKIYQGKVIVGSFSVDFPPRGPVRALVTHNSIGDHAKKTVLASC